MRLTELVEQFFAVIEPNVGDEQGLSDQQRLVVEAILIECGAKVYTEGDFVATGYDGSACTIDLLSREHIAALLFRENLRAEVNQPG
jgi:hypothetical protein